VIARSDEFYKGIGGPLYAMHPNGHIYAIFSGANEALAYWRGLDVRGREIFHIGGERLPAGPPHEVDRAGRVARGLLNSASEFAILLL
jgi:hypothetical protein